MQKLIVWDLDGTLVNSLQTSFDAFNDGIEKYLGRRLSGEEILAQFTTSEDQVVARLVGEKHAAECYQVVRRIMAERLHQIEPFDGVRETLRELTDAGYRFGIFTGRGRPGTEAILRNLELDDHFVEVVTSSDVENHKPHPEGLYKVCKAAGVAPELAIMIGDSHFDMRAGRSAGARTVGCLWDKMANRSALVEAEARHLIESITELPRLLSTTEC